jgi:general stress protein 26
MSDPVSAQNTHDDVPTDKKISELHKLIDGINVAMLTTRDAFGRLIARPMATQSHEEAADLWFMTSSETHKVEEIDSDSDVNVSYINGSKEWISISGTARLNTDRARIRKLYKPDWKAWFQDEGGDRNGGPDDPRIVLIEITAYHVTYFKVNEPRPFVLFEIGRAALTKTTPKVGAIRHLDP